MNRIITVSREFGSGGRELGRRLAERLGFEYYDNEIIKQIADHTSFSEEYIRQIIEGKTHRLYPITINNSFSYISDSHAQMVSTVYEAQAQVLRELAELSDCVIVGRCADYLLRDYKPFRIFVYASLESRMQRCMARGDGENLSESELRKMIRRIDRNRARYYGDCTGQSWGEKENYDLCINTSGREIKDLIPHLEHLL